MSYFRGREGSSRRSQALCIPSSGHSGAYGDKVDSQEEGREPAPSERLMPPPYEQAIRSSCRRRPADLDLLIRTQQEKLNLQVCFGIVSPARFLFVLEAGSVEVARRRRRASVGRPAGGRGRGKCSRGFLGKSFFHAPRKLRSAYLRASEMCVSSTRFIARDHF